MVFLLSIDGGKNANTQTCDFVLLPIAVRREPHTIIILRLTTGLRG